MSARQRLAPAQAMASPYRRRRMCVLDAADAASPATLRTISAGGAFLETNARPPLGAAVTLHHPEAGMIDAIVHASAVDGVQLRFEGGIGSMAFALAAITSDMTRG